MKEILKENYDADDSLRRLDCYAKNRRRVISALVCTLSITCPPTPTLAFVGQKNNHHQKTNQHQVVNTELRSASMSSSSSANDDASRTWDVRRNTRGIQQRRQTTQAISHLPPPRQAASSVIAGDSYDNRSRSRQKMKPMPITGYDGKAIEEFYDVRPLEVGWRLNVLGFPLLGWYLGLLADKAFGQSEKPEVQRKRGVELRQALVRSQSVALIKVRNILCPCTCYGT